MAFRFGAGGTGDARVTRTGGAPDPQAGGGWTVCGWWYLSVDRNDFSTMFRSHASSGSTTRLTLATKTDGTTPGVFTPGNTGGITGADAFTAGAWLFVAVVQSGTTATIYTCTPGGTMHSASGTSSGGSAPDGYTLGGRSASDASEWFNGRGRCVRQWAAALTPTELAAERDSLAAAVKTASLYSDHPLATGTDLSDTSGNGRTLTAGSGAGTTEADPSLGTSVADTAASLRIGVLPETPQTGVSRPDAAGAVRQAGLAEQPAVGAAKPDSAGTARVCVLGETPAVGRTVADAVGTARVAGLTEQPAAGVVLPEASAAVRVAALAESVFTGQTAPDAVAVLRVGALPEQPVTGLVLIDVISHVRVSVLPDTAAVGLALPDEAGVLRLVPLQESVSASGLVLADAIGVLRVTSLPEMPAGTGPAVPRDITVTATVLPGRRRAAILPSRWSAQEAR